MIENPPVTYQDDEFVNIGIEVLEGNPYIHVEVKMWNLTIARYLHSLWEQLKTDLWLEGYEYVFTYNPNEKFTKMFKGDWKVVRENEDTIHPVVVYYMKLEDYYNGI